MPNVIEFDYSSFLINSNKQNWTFLQAVKSLLTILFGVDKASKNALLSTQEKINQIAQQVLSSHINDESNILRLIRVVRAEGVNELKIKLPYVLDEEQIQYILDCAHVEIYQSTAEFDLLHVHLVER